MFYIKVFLIFWAVLPLIHAKALNNDCNDSGMGYCSKDDHLIDKSLIKKTLCELCGLTLPIARSLIENNRTQYFQGIITHLCQDLKISNRIVCSMAVSEYEVDISEID